MGAEAKKNRTVSAVLYAETVDMGGFPERQPLPSRGIDQLDPFLLLHHAEAKAPVHRKPKDAGIGPHPHRGFSPVTFVYKGAVHHRDSRGNSSVVYAGGTQWMNAGMGIIHSERPSDDIHEIGGVQEIIQLWINTPAAHKMDVPSYHPLSDGETPVVEGLENAEIKVVAGRYGGVKGPIPSQTEVIALRSTFAKEGQHFFQLPQDYNAYLYALDGQLKLEGYGLLEGLNLAILERGGDGIGVTAQEDTRFILMAGKPLNEPVVSQGPFVMNTTTEIMEAMRDYQMGKMGVLVEE